MLRFGTFELDDEAGQLRNGGRAVRLPPQPFKLLFLLASQPGRLVTRDEIRTALWSNDTFVDVEQGVNFAIKQVREALNDPAEHSLYIQTVPKRGYRFIAPVQSGVVAEPDGKNVRKGTDLRLHKVLWSNIAELRMAEERRKKKIRIALISAAVVAAVTVMLVLLWWLAPAAAAQPAQPLERREFVIRDFKTESGVVLPEARVIYSTLGKLNAAGDNAILLPSAYGGNFNGYNWAIGAGDRALDPARDFLILTEMFGNGRSSSPSNTPEPFHGPRFPITTIRDNIEAVRRLLTQELNVNHLRAIVGFSMGAEQAFQWAVSHATFVDAIVATAGTAKCYGHGYVRLEGQIAALTTDPAWENGDYKTPPTKGLEAFSMVWAGWLYSQEWWRRELWRTNPQITTFEQALQTYRRRFTGDANDYILQARAWQRHDVGTTPGFNGDTERALRSIKARVLYMPSETDLYFPIADARYEQAFIPNVTFTPIPSLWGHTAGAASNPADLKFLNENIARFLKSLG